VPDVPPCLPRPFMSRAVPSPLQAQPSFLAAQCSLKGGRSINPYMRCANQVDETRTPEASDELDAFPFCALLYCSAVARLATHWTTGEGHVDRHDKGLPRFDDAVAAAAPRSQLLHRRSSTFYRLTSHARLLCCAAAGTEHYAVHYALGYCTII
jgi:hypothetical protein